jgi:hypothetical protein
MSCFLRRGIIQSMTFRGGVAETGDWLEGKWLV